MKVKGLLESKPFLSSWGISLLVHSVILLVLGQIWLQAKLKAESPSIPFFLSFLEEPIQEEKPPEKQENTEDTPVNLEVSKEIPVEEIPVEEIPVEEIPVEEIPAQKQTLPEKEQEEFSTEIREEIFSRWKKQATEIFQDLPALQTFPAQVYQSAQSASTQAQQRWNALQKYVERTTKKSKVIPPKKAPVFSKKLPTHKTIFSKEEEPKNPPVQEKELPFTPARIKKVLPLEYPRFAERMEYEGVVTLRIQISETGQVLSTEVYKSSGYSILDESAQEQVRSWDFYPATRGQTQVKSWIRIPIRFQIP